MAIAYERPLDDHGDVTLYRSSSAFLKIFVITAFCSVWGVLGIIYCIAGATGNLSSTWSSPAIGIPLVVGLLANGILIFTIPFLLFPMQLTLNQSGILYTYSGRKRQMPWEEVTAINLRVIQDGRDSGSWKMVEIQGERGSIKIGQGLTMPVEQLAQMLSDLWKECAPNRYSRLSEESRIYAGQSNNGTSEDAGKIKFEKRLNTVKKIYLFIIIAITSFFMAGISFILWSLHQIHILR